MVENYRWQVVFAHCYAYYALCCPFTSKMVLISDDFRLLGLISISTRHVRKVAVRKGPSIDCHVLGAYEQGQQLMLFATGPQM
jgi:hypothetical protein